MSKPRPVCITCQKEMRVETSGVHVVLMAWDPPAPYEVWQGDEWKCPKCGAAFVTGFAERAIGMHFDPGFSEELAALRKSSTTYEVYER